MKKLLAIAAVLSLAAVRQDDEQGAKIEALIKQLGAEDFAAREKAGEELRRIGRPGLEALRKAAASDDPEVRTRARALAAEIDKAEAPRRPSPGFALPGGSVSIMSVNGDRTFKVTPGDGSEPITFHWKADGRVKLEYAAAAGARKSAEAESVEKFVKDHPELAAKYGITTEGINYGGARVSFKGGVLRSFALEREFRFPPPPEKEEEPADQAAGATLGPVPETVRVQFGIPEGQGLAVAEVAPGSDAEAAGLRRHDILLEVDGRKISSARDARELLRRTSSVAVLRKGRRESLAPKKDF